MAHYLFFDLDGTLSDTHDLSRATWLEVLRPYGIDVDVTFYQQHIRGRSQHEVIDALLPDLNDSDRRKLGDYERHSYRDRVRRAAPLPGLTPFMREASAHGYHFALVTNAPRADAHVSLEPLALDRSFEAMVFADEVGAHKPDPAPYRAALAAADITPREAIAFEDSPTGVRAAHAAGVPAIALATTHHPIELRDAGAALVIGDFADAAAAAMLADPEAFIDRGKSSA